MREVPGSNPGAPTSTQKTEADSLANAGLKPQRRTFARYNLQMRYTIRKIPYALDAALRRDARKQGKSLNQIVVEALARSVEFRAGLEKHRDLSDIAGSWINDPFFDEALASQDGI